ncbi:MAG: hypothetical protein K0R00_3408 [Herbinix sp.]|nr:hypothetical protein [Herbinix sp.]
MDSNKETKDLNIRRRRNVQGSLTIEAALILPVFLYFMLFFLFYIQIFSTQERIQSAISAMGLELSKTEYIRQDFETIEDALNFDFSIFNEIEGLGITERAEEYLGEAILKKYSKKYLDRKEINNSFIKNGFQGIRFISTPEDEEEFLDIIVSYEMELPIPLFSLEPISMLQRIRVRNWTGYQVQAAYQTETEEGVETTVYITATGTVYHSKEDCSHIKLSITSVQGIPYNLRNSNGAKYYPCESCCADKPKEWATYYITTDGTRYHAKRECSRIKRSVTAIKISERGNRTPCKRCYK